MQIATIGHTATMSSREIAELVQSSHDSVLKTVRRLIAEGVVSGTETLYKHPQNGQTYPQFVLDFRNTMVVASGYSAELRAKIIDRWQELEALNAPPPLPVFNVPTTFAGAPHLRFSEQNVHAQRKQCNRYGAGNVVGYRLGLIERIGLAAVEALEADNAPRKYTADDLRGIKAEYARKARELENARG